MLTTTKEKDITLILTDENLRPSKKTPVSAKDHLLRQKLAWLIQVLINYLVFFKISN